MTTRPHHTYEAIATDAERLAAAAEADLGDKQFAKHVDAHELAQLRADANKLKAGAASSTTKLQEQVGAGAHVAKACAALAETCRSIRDAAALEWLAEPKSKDESKARKFGYGQVLDASSLASVEGFAHALLASAEADPKDGAKVHLDAKGIHHVEDMLHALVGADVMHAKAKANRHDASTALDSLAHAVLAETAHVRFVARRVFRGDETKLAHYASTLPRHTVKPRSRHAPTPIPAS